MHDTKIPLGPHHPLMEEPEHLRLYVKGEEVIDTEFFLGYNHRGIEKIAETRTYDKVLYLVERICGICSNAHNTAFTRAVENASGLEPNDRAKQIRSIVTELERIQSHLLWFGTQSHALGFDTMFNYSLTYREDALDILEKISGNRAHYGLSEFGGTKRDINKETQEKMKKKLKKIKENTEYMKRRLMSNEPHIQRLKKVGKISKKKAKELGVVGPVARGSGIKIDTRKQDKHDAYEEVDFKVITEKEGDALARTKVRLNEVLESVRIINQLIPLTKGENRGKEEIKIDTPVKTFARSEAPRGENFHYLHTGEKTPKRLRIRPPTYANFMVLPNMIKGGKIADAPASVMSIDPCFSCTDRACVIDTETDEEKMQTFHDLVDRED